MIAHCRLLFTGPSPLVLTVLLIATLLGPLGPAKAFTEKQAQQIFDVLDPDHTGRVTKLQFELKKLNAFYFNREPTKAGQMEPLRFEDTNVSREFFDKADQGHKGYVDGIDIVDAIRFEDIDTKRRGYFDFADLRTFLNKIGR